MKTDVPRNQFVNAKDEIIGKSIFLKMSLLTAANMAGVMAFFRALNRHKVRILAYHGIDWLSEPVVNWDGLQVRPRVFRSHLRELSRRYHVVPLSTVMDALTNGGGLPDDAVAITFDDGYRNNLTVAAPILKEFGFPATFFVSTGFADGTASPWWYRLREAVSYSQRDSISLPDGQPISLDEGMNRRLAAIEWERHLRSKPRCERMECLKELFEDCRCKEGDHVAYPLMTREEVRQLSGLGFEIGPHTVSHISMSHESKDLIEDEIEASLSAVTDITGKPPTCYSYPHGALPKEYEDVLQMMKKRGVRGAVTTMEGMNTPLDDIFRLKRLNVSGHRLAAFSALMSGLTGMVRHE
jgi:peptidoglycan/xylan/chitin deacetylase (PgdA/CDA1 family)